MPTADRPAISYTPGTWPAVVRSGAVVLLRPGTDPALLDSLWSLLARQPEVHEVLDAVTAASGGSLARLPWFGIASLRGSLQVFLRGDIDLDVRLTGGETSALSGRDVTTWTERRFAAAGGFTLSAPAAALDAGTDAGPDADTGPAGGAPALPLGEGVVLLRELRWSPAGTPADASAGGPVHNAAGPEKVEEQLLAAAAADIAAEQDDEASSAQTVLDFPDEGLDGAPAGEPDAAGSAGPGEPETAAPASAGPAPADADAAGAAPVDAGPAEQEPTSSYDHLWEQTVMRNIEDAAVREDPDADEQADAPAPAPADAVPGPAGAGTPAEPPSAVLPPPTPSAAQEPEPAPALPAPAVPGGLIDSVPWRTGGDRPAPAAPAAPRAGAGPVAPPSLLAPPALPQPGRPAPQPAPAASDDADHDGQTVMKSDLKETGNPAGAAATAAAPPAEGRTPATGPMVLARMCPQGHANPPTNAQCAFCGQALQGDGVQIRRPRLGRMRLSTGELIDLDQSLIVGRQPSVSRVQGAVMPKLVQVASPSGDISRSHVQVRLEGWHVMLCDLKTTNGTVLLREDQAPRRLAQGEMAILFDGDIADLGDGIQLRFEELL